MNNWLFEAILHNLSINKPIENGYVAIVPATDNRAKSLTESSPALRRILSGFTDQFGGSVSPSLMIARPMAPNRQFEKDALIGFRNAIAICSIVKSWTEELVSRVNFNVFKYSNYFDIYPISVGRDGETILIHSLGIDRPEKFVGQISPELATSYRATSRRLFYDEELLNAILLVWKDRFLKRKVREWRSRVLFRSLEMAFHASTIPFENTSTIYDYGAKIALWVSAFEVLVRSKTEESNRNKVLDLLQRAQLYTRKLNKKLYTITYWEKGKKIKKRCMLSQKLYDILNSARNDFLHGNPVGVRNVFVNKSSKYHPLTVVGPILYKVALHSFLDIQKPTHIADYDYDSYASVRNYENAISSLIQKCA